MRLLHDWLEHATLSSTAMAASASVVPDTSPWVSNPRISLQFGCGVYERRPSAISSCSAAAPHAEIFTSSAHDRPSKRSNCPLLSNCDDCAATITGGLDPSVGAGRRWLESLSLAVSESFERSEENGKLGAEPENEQSGLAALLTTGIVSTKPGTPPDGEEGLWSVVIPTYNRLPILSQCLQALEDQRDYALAGIDRFEVLVVDDGSTDGTVEFLRGRKQIKSVCVHGKYGTGMCSQKGRYEVAREFWTSPTMSGRTGEICRVTRDGGSNAGNRRDDVDGGNRRCERFPHVRLVEQKHGGAAKARNLGLKHAKGVVVVFMDSDLIVTDSFLRAHGEALRDAFLEDGGDRAFTCGRVVRTSNWNPQFEKVRIRDYSAAFFATGNVAISRRLLFEAGELLGPSSGPFNDNFSEYGWEDLELGVRLSQCGARNKHAPAAVGYQWYPTFSVEQLPKLTSHVSPLPTCLLHNPYGTSPLK